MGYNFFRMAAITCLLSLLLFIPAISADEHVYVFLYVANIDGSADPIWYHFYDRITGFYEENGLPVLFSFFPSTLHAEDGFGDLFSRMYLAENIEFAQKGFNMDETERYMHLLSVEEQKQIISDGRDVYVDFMRGLSIEPDLPLTWVAPFSSFSATTQTALEELGFQTSFGLYYRYDTGPVSCPGPFDCMQYGVSFTTSGSAGSDTIFKDPDEIIASVKSYYRVDVEMLRIGGSRAIPLFVHHPDFEHSRINGLVNESKWDIYTETIERLMADPDITLLTPSQAWELNHAPVDRDPVCRYAVTAEATSENSISRASYALGVPDSPFSGVCGVWGGVGYSWNPANWNVLANLTLGFGESVRVDNVTVFGDYDMCWNRVWLVDSVSGESLQVQNGAVTDCVFSRSVDSLFYADTVVLETCGWAWSSTDAVQLCGIPKPVSEERTCLFGASAVATSQNEGSIPSYALGAPDSPFSGVCGVWGGVGYSWNPSNWNVLANLTVHFAERMKVEDVTVFGDYDMCWNRLWLVDSVSGESLQVQNGAVTDCVFSRSVDSLFYADTVVLETCGWAWSSTDAVQLCGVVS